MTARLASLLVLGAVLCAQQPDEPEPPTQVRIAVAASAGEIIPQAKGGGFQRTFRFTATPGASLHWIRQVVAVRGTVFDEDGKTLAVHLDIVEYYRVDASGKTIQHDSHYSQYRDHCGGDLEISSTLTYGRLEARKRGDTILGKTFILRGAKDGAGEHFTMRTRKGRVIPAEKGKRVVFQVDPGSIPTRYAYRVKWDARPGHGRRARPSGEIEQGTWRVVLPEQKGPTKAVARSRPIPRLER
jgi:hypothetical protein